VISIGLGCPFTFVRNTTHAAKSAKTRKPHAGCD
jgi:hypothetical protein